MKKAKRIVSMLLVTAMAFGMFTVSAAAAGSTPEREQTARVLHAMGLFKGYDDTGANFGLNDRSTREQALVFLIRMLGEEKAALAWTGARPYTDIPTGSWATPYIGYAKEKGLTVGVGNNKFGLGAYARMDEMTTFALRGLGYSDQVAPTDFTITGSLEFARSLGILDSSTNPDVFTRGNAVDIIDGAVAAKVKGQSYTLLEKLVSGGAVTQAQVENAAAIAAGEVEKPATGKNIAVTGVKLDQTTVSVAVGNTTALTGTIAPANATNQNVTWSSSSSSIAKVDANGVVTGVKAGTATITAKTVDGSKTATCKVTVTSGKNVAVTGVKLDQTTASVAVGKTTALTGTIAPANATNQNVTWSSSSSSVAKVDANGVVTGVKAGTATITAKTVDGSKTATCRVTVTAATADKYTDKTVNLYNSTSNAVTDVRISSTQNTDWGSNLTSGAVNADASVTILVPVSSTDYTYDIKITYKDGSVATFSAYNFKNFTSGGSLYAHIVNNVPTLSTTKPGSAPVIDKYTDKTVNLYNSTSNAVTDVRISSTQNTDWGSNLTSGAVNADANVAILVPVSSTDYTYDIKITYKDGSVATFSAYNFKNFTSGGSLYAHIVNNVPTLSTTKPTAAPDTSAASKALDTSYNTTVTRFNNMETALRTAGLFDSSMQGNWNSFANDLNSTLGFIGKGTGSYTEKQISDAKTTLSIVNSMLDGMDTLIKNNASKPQDRTITVKFVNNTTADFTGFKAFTDGSSSNTTTLVSGDTTSANFTVPSTSTTYTVEFTESLSNQSYTLPFTFDASVTTGTTLTIAFSVENGSVVYSQS